MNPYFAPVEKDTLENHNFRKVVYTGNHLQVVLMSLLPGEDIGQEVHADVDQFFRFESGLGKVIVNGNEFSVQDGDAFVVPAGSEHNVINTGTDALKLYTIYAPANHPDGTTHATKAEAEEYEKQHHG